MRVAQESTFQLHGCAVNRADFNFDGILHDFFCFALLIAHNS